ncbi:MAG: hypothetical protein ACRYGI_11455 [Janthinobacterium lividum]
MTMIERVAAAMVGVDGVAYESSVEDLLPLARAAIVAMREPTGGMPRAWVAVWERMIDAALAE